MHIYLVHCGKYGEPNLVFDNLKLAEEALFSRVREMGGGGFSFSIFSRQLNSLYNQFYEDRYVGSVKTVGNLRFIEINSKNNFRIDEVKHKEVLTLYQACEETLIDTQLHLIIPSNPKNLYFNSITVLETFKFSIRNKGLLYKRNGIEEVTDDWIKEYFKYRIYLSSYDRDGEEK
jgi:hypothetical protein